MDVALELSTGMLVPSAGTPVIENIVIPLAGRAKRRTKAADPSLQP
jgi:hypothetical protein